MQRQVNFEERKQTASDKSADNVDMVNVKREEYMSFRKEKPIREKHNRKALKET